MDSRLTIRSDRVRRLAAWPVRRATAPLRKLPDILVIGAMRAGTSSLFDWLGQQPQMQLPPRKEIHFFDHHYHRGLAWYRAWFPTRRGVLTVDNTPSYMAHSESAMRAAEVVPEAKVIALLRDPVERAWSHYRFRAARGHEDQPFDALVEEQISRGFEPFVDGQKAGDIPILSGGLYASQLRPWFEEYGEDGVLIVDSDELFGESNSEIDRVVEFLGLESDAGSYRQRNSSPWHPMPPEVRERLQDFYADPNRSLREMVGENLSWL